MQCCDNCNKMPRDQKFNKLLNLLHQSVSSAEQLIHTSLEIMNLKHLMAPLSRASVEYFDQTYHVIDQVAQFYLSMCDQVHDLTSFVPVDSTGGGSGSCLYSSILILMPSLNITTVELRVRTILELINNQNYYELHCMNTCGPLHEYLKNACKKSDYSELYEIVALCNVLQCDIQSVYPHIDYGSYLDVFNYTYGPSTMLAGQNKVRLLWSNTQYPTEYKKLAARTTWSPNHFVPLVPRKPNTQSQISILPAPSRFGSELSNITSSKGNMINSLQSLPSLNHFSIDKADERKRKERVRKQLKRQNENIEERTARLTSAKLHAREVRSLENDEQRNARLTSI
ncbi:unnamed protein product [Didymodactylos carnosus]|uniref:OTU domain-containing protein n=1 Tax=Didymodactylos carnosus TaxID=1234261 RepID=A0A815VC83_9BILA|nr:unnamed protein product [Didymodactylos carnosus]CAF4387757.1 unnamed protein product [Didymodactylos carnosus]